MPDLRPFRGLTPLPGRAAEVASPPYDVLSAAEARAICTERPDSFVHVVRSDALLSADEAQDATKAYERAALELRRLIDEGALVRSERPTLYAYRLQWRGRSQTGVVGLASVKDYDAGRIKKHEHTRPDKERDRAEHIEHLQAQCGPVFLICPATSGFKRWCAEVTEADPLHDFTAEGVRHTLWAVAEPDRIASVRQEFARMDATYVADGHHRSAAASVVWSRRGEVGEDDPAAGFLTVTFPDDEVEILPYNRIVADLAGLTPAELMARIGEKFEVGQLVGEPGPSQSGVIDMYLDGTWSRLTARPMVRSVDPVDGLDVAMLQDHLLGPLLSIGDPRTDTRISFVGGIRGCEELRRRVDSGEGAVAFALSATPVSALLAVARSGRVMPPKSTWFEPKLRSGLFVHLL